MVVPIHLRDGAEEPPNPSLARNRTVLEAVGANLPRAKHGTQDGGKKRYWSQRRGANPEGGSAMGAVVKQIPSLIGNFFWNIPPSLRITVLNGLIFLLLRLFRLRPILRINIIYLYYY